MLCGHDKSLWSISGTTVPYFLNGSALFPEWQCPISGTAVASFPSPFQLSAARQLTLSSLISQVRRWHLYHEFLRRLSFAEIRAISKVPSYDP